MEHQMRDYHKGEGRKMMILAWGMDVDLSQIVFVKMQEMALGDETYTHVTHIDNHGRITENKDFRDQDWTKGYVSVTDRYIRLIALIAAMKMAIAN